MLNFYLSTQDLLANFAAIATYVRSSSHHTLVTNDTHSKVIGYQSVILSTHDFRCHISRRSRCFARILRSHDSCDAEVSQSEIAIVVKDKVFRFNVSMNNVCCVDGIESVDKTRDEKSCLILRKLSLSSDVVSEITAKEQVHY